MGTLYTHGEKAAAHLPAQVHQKQDSGALNRRCFRLSVSLRGHYKQLALQKLSPDVSQRAASSDVSITPASPELTEMLTSEAVASA